MERRAPRVLPFWAAVVAVLGWLTLVVWLFVGPHAPTAREIAWSDFKTAIAERRIESVVVSPATVRGTFRPDASGAKESFVTVRVEDPAVVDELVRAGVRVEGEPAPGDGAGTWLRIGLVALLIAFVVSGFRRGAAGPIAAPFGKSHARVYMEKEVGVSFADVAGVDEAIEELKEVITFLTEPEKFRKLGGKIPKGILLVGPPGTGKTLLARAVAGEANVPFFSISGSEFVELFVGVGAARVRDLFRQAKEKAPCIIFIDELDALGKTRVAGPMAHEEREQTLNQLLVELDGFDPRGGVVLMAATNRPEILDPALLRAGRFDRRIAIDRPEKAGRRAILSLHVRDVPLAPDADLDVIAGMTPGMAGADLANLVNEAALLAVRRGKDRVGMSELVEAVERVVAGLEKRTRVLSPPERRRVAVHELGHALVALSLPGADPVRKISIIPRGVSLGHTLQTPAEDRFLTTQRELEARVAVLLGGRAAEQLVFGEVSTGAHDDLTRASEIAEAMVREFGMSRRLGARAFPREPSFEGFLRAEAVPPAAETAQEIETEIAWILDQQEAHATRILAARRAQLEAATGLLLERETIGADELARLETPPSVTRAPGEASPVGNAARTA